MAAFLFYVAAKYMSEKWKNLFALMLNNEK